LLSICSVSLFIITQIAMYEGCIPPSRTQFFIVWNKAAEVKMELCKSSDWMYYPKGVADQKCIDVHTTARNITFSKVKIRGMQT